MTLSEFLTDHPQLAQREVETWQIEGPYVNEDGSQELVVVLTAPTSEINTRLILVK